MRQVTREVDCHCHGTGLSIQHELYVLQSVINAWLGIGLHTYSHRKKDSGGK